MGIEVILTGFGQFEGIQRNPTEEMINILINKQSLLCNSYYTLKVAVNEVNLFYNLFPSLSNNNSNNNNNNNNNTLNEIKEDNNKVNESNESNEKNLVLIHLGVHSKTGIIRLEKYAYNNMTFRVPDQNGQQPENQSINNLLSFDQSLQTDFNLEIVSNILNSEGYNCCISDDPGRYLCNYTYFQSLSRIHGNKYVLFIHVPPAEVLPIDEQIKFLERCIPLLIEQVTQDSST